MGYGASGGDDSRSLEEQRQARIKEGKAAIDANFARFDEPFYNRRAQDYENFAQPQLGQQYQETKRGLTYNLARSGMLRSGVAVQKGGALERETAQQRRGVVDAGQREANTLRRDVEGNRSQAVAQLEASADPAAAASSAQRNAAMFDTRPTFQPIGNFFENWSRTYLANQDARANDPSVRPLFGWGDSSSRMVN